MTLHNKRSLFLLTAILGGLFSYFFFEHEPGLSVLAYMTAITVVFFALFAPTIDRRHPMAWFLLVAGFILSGVIAVYNHPLAHVSILLIPLTFIASTILFTGNNVYRWYDPRSLLDIFPNTFGRSLVNLGKPFRLIGDIVPSPKIDSTFGKVVAGIALALPLIVIIVALLAAADPVFDYLFVRPPQWLANLEFADGLARVLVAIGVYTFFAAYFWTLLNKPENHAHEALFAPKRKQDTVIAMTILCLINVVYILFVVVQFKYLFGGADLSFLKDFTYAQYARQGFGQLVAITLLNGLLILGALYTTKQSSKSADYALKAILSLTCILTVLIVASAVYRMSLYQDAYGFTHLRLFVHVFEFWLGFVILALMTRVIIHTFPFAKVFAVSAIAVYLVLNCLNIDAHIAKKNLARPTDVVAFDETFFLWQLSDDAYVQKNKYLKSHPPDAAYLNRTRITVDGWQSWNYFRWKARQ